MHMLTMSEIIHFTVNYTHFTTHASLANNAEHFRGQATQKAMKTDLSYLKNIGPKLACHYYY